MAEETNFMSEMANRLMKNWTEVNTQALKSWFDLMGLANCNPIVDSQPEFELINQGIVGYQQLQLRLLKLSFNAWREILLKFESGEDWQQPFSNNSQKLRNQVEEFFEETLKNSQEPAELWQIYLKQIQPFNQLLEYSDDLKSKSIRAFEAWAKLYPTSINYQMVLSQIQMQTFEELIPEMILLASKGEKVKDWLQFQQLWSRTADKLFEQAFCIEDNIKVRGKFLNAVNNYKLCQQDLMEVWMEMMNLPTRSEVDEVHKSIYELRKEVKSLKKTLAKYEVKAQETPQDPEEPTQKEHWTTALFTRRK